MATTYGTTSASKSADYDMSLWYDSKYYKLGLI
ncbi:MAG: methane monooxygenase/ammonia monooxygenase subunit C, partial [Nitrosomonas sp. PRO4]|nr:methane monooxygenase/ammonia monooxygenase subunit C [Nitrosomonas sp. PRO4]MCE7915382.1 methane monooxygenase/ammonia monooxygenase subunit C [Nitrosomonas sp. PRO4]